MQSVECIRYFDEDFVVTVKDLIWIKWKIYSVLRSNSVCVKTNGVIIIFFLYRWNIFCGQIWNEENCCTKKLGAIFKNQFSTYAYQ